MRWISSRRGEPWRWLGSLSRYSSMIFIASSSAVMVEMLVRSSVERHARESIETAMMDPMKTLAIFTPSGRSRTLTMRV